MGEYAKIWQDRPENVRWANRKSKRMAEFLIYQKVDLADIIDFAVINEEMKQKLDFLCKKYGIDLPIIIRREWYK